MELVGDILKSERKKKNLSLSDISKETKILKRHLEQIENNDFTSIGGQVYTEGFIRLYAAELDINPKKLIELYHIYGLPKIDVFIEKQKKTFEWRYLLILIQIIIVILVLLYE